MASLKLKPWQIAWLTVSSLSLSTIATTLVFAAGPGVNVPYSRTFDGMLAHAYGQFAHLEEGDRTDQIDANELKQRALAAHHNMPVMPLTPDEVRSVQASPAQLNSDYAAIQRVLANNQTRTQHPREVAMAQAAYDCYALQQQFEPYASHNLHRCEPTFRYLMAKLDKPIEPTPIAAEPTPNLVEYRYDVVDTQAVYFDWDKASLNQAARQTLDEVKNSLAGPENSWKRVALNGFADRSGPSTYNQRLSKRRVEAVASYLNIDPVDMREVDLKAYGESNLPVATADGVREARNRVVQVAVVKERTSTTEVMPNTDNPQPDERR